MPIAHTTCAQSASLLPSSSAADNLEINLGCLLPADATDAARQAMPTAVQRWSFKDLGDGQSASDAEARGLSATAAMAAAVGQQALLKGQRRGTYFCCETLAALAMGAQDTALSQDERQAAEAELLSTRRALLETVFACGGWLPLAAGGEVTVTFRLDVRTTDATWAGRKGLQQPWFALKVQVPPA